MINFALIGAAGYIAPRHMKAIKDVGGELVAALDPHDSVGVLDSYFPDCAFFTEFERFDRHCEKLRREGRGIDYVSIASLNYLHDAHSRFALRIGADAICEKPLVLNERNLDAIKALEEETGHRVWGVYQLRYHPEVQRMKEFVSLKSNVHSVDIIYRTPRGKWYDHSWKCQVDKSGGLPTNIGCHLFDIAAMLFGKAKVKFTSIQSIKTASGIIEFAGASVMWGLFANGSKPQRSFKIDNEPFDLNGGFTELHTEVYRQILAGNGIGIEDVRESVRICEAIRQQ